MAKSIFSTDKKENLKSTLTRIGFNFFPAYRRTGGRIIFLSADWRDVHVKLSLTWKTKNYVGTVFGGSIYAALDPIYMIQLINILGKEYVVWDKAASVNFIKPIKSAVFARFLITDELLTDIINQVSQKGKYVLDIPVTFQDSKGVIHASVSKTMYIASKDYYKESLAKKQAKQ